MPNLCGYPDGPCSLADDEHAGHPSGPSGKISFANLRKETATMMPAQRPAPATRAPSRMQLANVTKGRLATPLRLVIYGEPGVGKSTFGADAPAPIFLATEEGTSELDCARFPEPQSWTDVLDALAILTDDAHQYRTLVVDTLDWLEPLIWRAVCESARVESIEEVGGGYGKGYTAALDLWRVFLSRLEHLSTTRGMHVVLVCHAQIKRFANPLGEDYDRYQLKLNDKASGLIREWAKAVLFARSETFSAKDPKTKRVRGTESGRRILHTVGSAAYEAKNRYDLPEILPLSWADFEAASGTRQPASAETLRAAIAEMLQGQPAELVAAVTKATTAAGDDAAQLYKIANRLNTKITENAK